ncbi:hypothetical protein POSPLADRAFT_1056444 [Postia placenta MAD-698-R-SB12]|uniref:Uncharacterized protein n=1 Tax=Postia placenta MAD-698-R-SB12 TaxID=670580 RepID=A0A1X6N3B7_9APHY|nr:hypothetical protein POSPLADRAFT_1056444 [Postia placenta MAD-698-R-SB12]OSX63094.1 hypothetical protein POSPLADRAFT_1056444 [Postia placenta MAD-698-R-SB12]
MSSKLSNGIYLRSSINAEFTKDPQVLAAFSPDIIPLGQTQPKHEDLISSYDQFIAHDIDIDEAKTRIYIRGKAVISKYTRGIETQVSLKAIPNELILWPQAWTSAADLGQVVLKASKDGEGTSFEKPPHVVKTDILCLGRHDTFIAKATSKNASLEDLVPKVQNWRDLVKYIGQDPTLATYNVVFADPCSTNVSLTTRLRLFDNKTDSVDMVFGIEAVGIPAKNIDASLSCFGATPDYIPFSFGHQRVHIAPSTLLSTKATVPVNFDGTITLNVFNDTQQTFGDYSSISLIAYAVTVVDGQETFTTLGAEHVVFHSNIRVKKLLRKYEVANDGPFYPFYFRDNLSDGPDFPRVATHIHLLPLGVTPDPNVEESLGPKNYYVDISNTRNEVLHGNTSNYIYIRDTTTAPTSGKVRLYAFPNNILLHPSLYDQESNIVWDYNDDGERYVAIRSYSTNSAASLNPILLSEPFSCADRPLLPAGHDHYSLVAECKPDGTGPDGAEYLWPHTQVDDFRTAAEFTAWVQNGPYVALRSVEYMQNADAASYVLRTGFTIPEGFSPTDYWVFRVRLVNCPVGSAISFDSSDPEIQYSLRTITTPETEIGIIFTGKAPGFNCQIAIRWFANGKSAQPGQRIVASLVYRTVVTTALAYHLTCRKNIGKLAEPFEVTVGDNYPNLEMPDRKKGHPKVGGAHVRRVLGDKYSVAGGIHVDYVVGVDTWGHNLT